jgi:hypothetical protein
MKKLLFILLSIVTFAPLAEAQGGFTTVTGTITDPSGITYACGTISAQLITAGGAAPTLNGGGFTTVTSPVQLGCPTSPGTGAPGSFTMRLADSGVISPSNTTWQFTVNMTPGVAPPEGTGPQSFVYTTAINCSTNTPTTCTSNQLSISSPLSALAPKLSNAGGSSSPSSIPGFPGVTAVPVTSGLMAEYRMLPTETPASLVDYSGNANNATGTVGVAPTIIAGSGGITMNRNGAISLPASLNSALTIMLVLNASDSPGTGIGLGSPLYGSAGPVANSVGLAFASSNQDSSQFSTAPMCCYLHAMYNATPTNAQVSRAQFKGNTVLAWTMDTTDKLYTNGVLATQSSGLGNGNGGGGSSSAGRQTTGNFQLGGQTTSLFGITLYFTGSIYYAVFYNRVLSPTEVQQNTTYLQNTMAARAVPPIIYSTAAAAQDMLVLDGDSLTFGTSPSNPSTPYSNYAVFTPATWTIENLGVGGQYVGSANGPSFGAFNGAPTAVDPFFNPSGGRNAVVIWIGTNDRTEFGNVPGYCTARRKLGFKCFIVSLMSSNGADAAKNTFNAYERQNWPSFADGFMDVGSDPLLGADGASGSATWFNGGGPHLFTQGYANLVAPIIQRGIARYYGNTSFSAATTYVAAATAAVATTAGSSSTNTSTITFAATPANCQVGNGIVLAGITPAGYNTPAGHTWQILTQSATQISFYNPVSGLGAITVQGTGVCPQQQDVDTYSILNFGAGNFTLESCVGYTGQNIYIRNINAAASTLVPFASETITGGGATPTTLAANTTAILQSQLVSASAAGCNWVRLQ